MPETDHRYASQREFDDLRNTFNRSQDVYRADRGEMSAAITAMRRDIDTFRGGLGFVKWSVGLSVPAIISLLIAILLTKH